MSIVSVSTSFLKKKIVYREIKERFNLYIITELFRDISVGHDNMKTSTACAWVATTPYVLTVDPEVIKHITTSSDFLNKATDLYTHFHNGILNGIIVSPGDGT